MGIEIIHIHPLFDSLDGRLSVRKKDFFVKGGAAICTRYGEVLLNQNILLEPEQWAYAIAHCRLHYSFGHFDLAKYPFSTDQMNYYLWNKACDLYIAKFLQDMKFGKPLDDISIDTMLGSTADEGKIYQYLIKNHSEHVSVGGTNGAGMDCIGLEVPMTYPNDKNPAIERFAYALAYSVSKTVGIAGGHSMLSDKPLTIIQQAASWFISAYPLLGALAAGFKLIEDYKECQNADIQIAAINVTDRKIYCNPSLKLKKEEWKFILAHEFLHAGLQHHERRQGRDFYLWNIACDFTINGWLKEMGVGELPEIGVLYDETLKGLSAEDIYDRIINEGKRYIRLDTFRGYGQGDILDGSVNGKNPNTTLDDFCKNALAQGLEFHISNGRGYLPAGLIEEIRALAMPPIRWDIELARWFDGFFGSIEKKRSYARPSRRQASSPDIPRPRYVIDEALSEGRTFGVVLDTSGSMDVKLLGKALGAIASYAASKEVPFVRVIFCDADAYDVGYLAPEEIAGRIKVKGRGGTVLQPAIHQLENAKDFPKNGPILVITDGFCDKLTIHREHAFLLPKGRSLPFQAKGKVFRFD